MWAHLCVSTSAYSCQAIILHAMLRKRAVEQEAPEPEEIYCICRQPDDPNRAFIECEECKEGFHPECVGTSLQVCNNLLSTA